MITWMQRHKKYLVVTIWISTIAFVGAGFVGWGAYDFNTDRASAVAKVGDQKITVKEFQMAYSNLYGYYNNLFQGQLTQEKAKEMGLEKIVLENVINEALLLNYARDLGLVALDSDIKEQLASDPVFQNEGKFDKEQYYRVLKNAGYTAKDYENSLKKQILLNKVNAITNLAPTDKELELLASAFFMKDRLAISTISVNTKDIIITDTDLKTFWEPQKSSFLTKKSYVLDTIYVPANTEVVTDEEAKSLYEEKKYNYKDADGKLQSFEDAKAAVIVDLKLQKAKKAALETYLLFKKGQTEAQETKTIQEGDLSFPADKLVDAKVRETLKPIPQGEGYIIAQVKAINFPQPMSFEEAKPLIVDSYKQAKITEALQNKATAQLEAFQGTDIGFVSRDDVKAIAGLTEEEAALFLSKVFENNKDKRGFVVIGNRAVLYDILEQKLLDETKVKQYNTMLSDNVNQVKNGEIRQNLIEALRKRYTTEQYYKGN